jgi:hypothetical protein
MWNGVALTFDETRSCANKHQCMHVHTCADMALPCTRTILQPRQPPTKNKELQTFLRKRFAGSCRAPSIWSALITSGQLTC